LLGEQLGPGRQRTVGGLDGRSRLRLAEARHLGDDVAGGLVGDWQLRVAGPLAVDVALASDQADGGFVHERLHSTGARCRISTRVGWVARYRMTRQYSTWLLLAGAARRSGQPTTDRGLEQATMRGCGGCC